MTSKPSIAILGAGVSGLTTGAVLNLAGYETTVFAEHLPTWLAYERNHPEFSSLYAAASVLPHGVTIEDPVRHLERSQQFFDRLTQMPGFPVRTQRHFELFERERPEMPAYLSAARRLSEIDPGSSTIYRTAEMPVYGWSYDAYVVDMPGYLRQLLSFYRETGGTVVQKRLNRRSFLARRQDLLVNCSGLGALRLVDDPAPYQITRGHLVYVDIPAATPDDTWTPLSYNYMPTADIYCQSDGCRADVYFYPRSDRWVLGGSRWIVASDERPERTPPAYPSSTTTIGDIDVPEPIVRLNRRLLEQITGIDVLDYPMQAAFGYRFERDPVRLESSREDGRVLVHNYGHGGAGLTLSWSCAVEVLEIVEGIT